MLVEKQVDKLGDLSVFEKVAVKDGGKVASKVETTAVLKAFHWVLQLAFYTAVQMVDGMVLSSDADWVLYLFSTARIFQALAGGPYFFT